MPPRKKRTAKKNETLVASLDQPDEKPVTVKQDIEEEEEETEATVTYYVDEQGRYYYQPAGEDGNITVSMENTNNQENHILTDGENYQTVTLLPSETEGGEVSYVLVVQNDIDNNLDLNVNDSGKGEDVYTFEEENKDAGSNDETQDYLVKKRKITSRPSFTCTFCNYVSHRKYLLIRHMKSHSDERPHKCKVCDRGFKTHISLQNHLNMHNGVKPHVCKYCSTPFTTSGELVRHVRYKHTHEKPHRCTECDYASVELSKLRRHVRCHTGERPYQCPHCTYASPDTFKLKRHLRTHTGEKPYKCDQCNMCFTQSNSLKAHKLIHNVAEKPVYACELCPAKCGRKTDLRIHVQKMHTSDVPLKCKRCGKTFPDRYSCKVHNKTHEGEKCFKCDFCPYASTTLRHLKSHLLKHTDEKPFVCDECNQSFRQKQLLRRHQNLYHNPNYSPKPPKEKTHVCHECNRTFAHKGNLIRHLAVHDPDSGHRERSLALKLGRQKKVKLINGQLVMRDQEMESASNDKEDNLMRIEDNEVKREVVTVADDDGQQYVVLEVIQLEDGSEQQVCVVAPKMVDLKNQQEVEIKKQIQEPGKFKESPHKNQIRNKMPESVKVLKDLDSCFGFNEEEEQPEAEDQEENIRLVYEESDDEKDMRLVYEVSDGEEKNMRLVYEESDDEGKQVSGAYNESDEEDSKNMKLVLEVGDENNMKLVYEVSDNEN